jgi:hypothetical protein
MLIYHQSKQSDFYFILFSRPWQMPVQLMKVQKLNGKGKPLWEAEERSTRESWHGNLGISTALQMPVVSPWIEDDISFSPSNIMTENTKQIVMNAMQNGECIIGK